MKFSLLRNSLVVGTLLTALSLSAAAQTARRAAAMQTGSALAASLPASDTVALVKVKRLLDEALPKLLANNPAKLPEVNARLDNFKTRTGIDPRAFNEIALGLNYEYPSATTTKVTTVALARGTFNSATIVAAGRNAASGTYRQEQYQGKTVYVFSLDEKMRVLGLFDLKVRELAVSPLDANTLALGDVLRVHNAIDARRAGRRNNTELIALASQNQNAIVGFGGNVSPALLEHLRIGNDAVARDLASVRHVYGSVGMTEKDLEVLAAARTADPAAAKSLGSTVEGLTALAGLFTSRLPAAKAALARSALGNLKVTVQGNDLQLRTSVGQGDLGSVLGL